MSLRIVGQDDPDKLELELVTNDSMEILNAEPNKNRWGVTTGYKIKRTNGTVTMSGRIACADEIKKKGGMQPWENIPTHTGCPINCCKHIFAQDPVHPEGFVLMPYGLFACKTCLNLLERKKFKYKDIVMYCRDCVEVQAMFLKDINPDLFKDLRIKA